MAVASALRQRLIVDHVGLARNIARRLARLYSSLLDPEEIQGPAMVGLCEAASRFDPCRSEPFVAFAEQRIRGAVLDELRRRATFGRVTHRRQRSIAAARHAITQTGVEATDDRVAEHLGLSVSTVQKACDRTTRLTDDDLAAVPCSTASPEVHLECLQVLVALARARELLPEEEAEVVKLHYDSEIPFARIARLLDRSVSRVAKLHARAIARLRGALRDGEHRPAGHPVRRIVRRS